MLTTFIEVIASRLIINEIRDEAMGELWELDHRESEQGTSPIIRALKNTWNLCLLIKASLAILLEDLQAEDIESKEKESPKTALVELLPSPRKPLIHRPKYVLNSLGFEQGELDMIKSYCDLRKFLTPEDSREFLKYKGPYVEHWFRQIDRITAKNRYRGQSIPCESILNSFILSSFIRKIESTHPDTVTPEALQSLVQNLNLSHNFLRKYADYRNSQYVRKLICKTWSLAVYVISWEAHQESWMHHHGYALDAIKVIQGTMTHWQLSPEEKSNRFPFESFDRSIRYEGPHTIVKAGETVVIDRLHAHQIANLSNRRLLTLHIRLGHPPEDHHWRTTADTEMFVWNQTEECFDLYAPESFNPTLK